MDLFHLTHTAALILGFALGIGVAARPDPESEPCLALVSEPGRSYLAKDASGHWIAVETGERVTPAATTIIQPVGDC